MVFPYFEQCELERISEILGDTNSGFTNSEIDRLLKNSSIPDDKSNTTKRWRIFNSLIGKCKKIIIVIVYINLSKNACTLLVG